MRRKVEKIRKNTMKKYRNFLYIHQEPERNLNVLYVDKLYEKKNLSDREEEYLEIRVS
jgi:hypothetical protein